MQIQRLREYQDTPNPALRDYIAAKSAFDQAKRHLDEVQARLIEEMQEAKVKSLELAAAPDAPIRRVTFVQNTTYQIDEKGLRRALTAKVYDRFTKKVLDRPALEKAMGDGEVDPMTVAKYVTEQLGKPYLRYSERNTD